MRALVISDAHFGAWTGEPLLRHEFALEVLAPQLEDIDELVLLGDLFDFLFSSVENAFGQADGLFELVRERLQGRRVTFLAGNHDHHIMVRELRSLIELMVATGAMDERLTDLYRAEHRGFFQRFLERRLEGVDCRIVYPTHSIGDVLLFHGHYLDAHLRNSLPNRLLARSTRTVAGGHPETRLTLEDYEAVIVPLTEFLFTIAQMPRGTASQQAFYAHLQSIGRVLRIVSSAGIEARRLSDWVRLRARTIVDLGRKPAYGGNISSHLPVARPCDPTAPPSIALRAFVQVVRNLGWQEQTDKIVFAHTHQPLTAVCSTDGIRFWNTGSWIYEPSHGSPEAYRSYLARAWPGTGVVIDTENERPELVQMLAVYNPLNGGGGLPVTRDAYKRSVSATA